MEEVVDTHIGFVETRDLGEFWRTVAIIGDDQVHIGNITSVTHEMERLLMEVI